MRYVVVGQALRLATTREQASEALVLQIEFARLIVMPPRPRVFLPVEASDF